MYKRVLRGVILCGASALGGYFAPRMAAAQGSASAAKTPTAAKAPAAAKTPAVATKASLQPAERDVVATIDHMTSGMHTMDIGEVMSTYEKDCAVAFQPGSPTVGADKVRGAFLQSFAVKPRFKFGNHEVLVVGDIALHLAPWKMSGTAPDGKALQEKGLSVAVLRKQADGKWRMVIDNPHGERLVSEAGYPE